MSPDDPEHLNRRSTDALPSGDLDGFDFALGDLVDKSADTIIFLDRQHVVRYWNRGAVRMFQYEPEEALGRSIAFLVPKDLLQRGELEQLETVGEKVGVVYNYQTRRIRKDGVVLWMSLTRTVLHDRQGAVIGAIATLRDVSEQHAHEEELQRSRRLALVGELAAKIAHEVKNPLTGIYAALQVLEGQLEATDPNREVFQSIGEEVMRLNAITQELLQFSRPTEPRLRKADLASFLRDLSEDLGRLNMVESGELDLAGLAAHLPLQFDADLTGQIFKNLILNAVQANGGKGQVRISSRSSEGLVAIDIADDGPGIPAGDRDTVFDPFFTTKSRGTGLGLSIARKNIELQGGSIRLRSQRGQGATFRVEFPTT